MFRRLAEYCLLAAVFLMLIAESIFAPGVAEPASSQNSLILEMMGKTNKTEIYNNIEFLQNYQTRYYGTDDNSKAATYLFNELSKIPGLKVEYQNGNLKNIVATLPGLNNSSDEIVMIGAHYDSTSYPPELAPGATDNACGVAIVLELARIISIPFQSFNCFCIMEL